MPIGVVSDSEFESELNSYTKPQNNVITPDIVEMERPGRKEGDVNIPDSLRKVIGETAIVDGRQEALAIARMFGVSDSSVSAYSQGATSTSTINTPNKDLFAHLNKSRTRAIKKAQKKLDSALDALTPEKLDYADAKDLSTIAKDMSVIIKNLEPEKVAPENDGKPSVQFTIFAPQFRQENAYEVVKVLEE